MPDGRDIIFINETFTSADYAEMLKTRMGEDFESLEQMDQVFSSYNGVVFLASPRAGRSRVYIPGSHHPYYVPHRGMAGLCPCPNHRN